MKTGNELKDDALQTSEIVLAVAERLRDFVERGVKNMVEQDEESSPSYNASPHDDKMRNAISSNLNCLEMSFQILNWSTQRRDIVDAHVERQNSIDNLGIHTRSVAV